MCVEEKSWSQTEFRLLSGWRQLSLPALIRSQETEAGKSPIIPHQLCFCGSIRHPVFCCVCVLGFFFFYGKIKKELLKTSIDFYNVSLPLWLKHINLTVCMHACACVCALYPVSSAISWSASAADDSTSALLSLPGPDRPHVDPGLTFSPLQNTHTCRNTGCVLHVTTSSYVWAVRWEQWSSSYSHRKTPTPGFI